MRTKLRKLRSPLKAHGGKSYLARRINALMPYRPCFVETHARGLSVLLNRARASREIINDLDPWIARFWEVMADPDRFPRMWDPLARMPYDETSFKMAKAWLRDQEHPEPEISWDKLDRTMFARWYLVRNRMSRGGLGETFAWSDRLRGGQPGDVNAWKTFVGGEILHVHSRVQYAEVRNQDAVEVIREFDSPDTLFYCDPPYPASTRTAKKAYGAFEMTDEAHLGLLNAIKACKGTVFISGYACPMYDEALAGWRRTDFDMPNHSGQGKAKQRRVECLWDNTELLGA